MKVLILGGNGYIGTQLVDHLIANESTIKITVVDCDQYTSSKLKKSKYVHYITGKYQDLDTLFFKEFNVIILLAGQGSTMNNKNLLHVIDNNVRNFAWLLEQLSEKQKLIYASSSSVYGKTDNHEVSEDMSGYTPYNNYDWSKQTIDQLAGLRSGQLQIYGLRFGTVNGFSRNLRNDIMINSMCYNAKLNGKIYVSNPNVNRPILGINDLCKAVVCIMYNGTLANSGIYNLNSFNSSVEEIAKNVARLCDVEYEEVQMTSENQLVNFKLQTKTYDFKINSFKFINAFKFAFEDTLETITTGLLDRWDTIANFQNRLNDKFEEYKTISNCRVCDTKTNSLLDLGTQPLANSYTKFSKHLDYNPLHINIEDKFPLHLHYCPHCFLVQLNCVVNPDKLFKDYIYVSGTSQTLQNYFSDFAKSCLSKQNKVQINVLDIACNDGSQLDAFRKFGNDNVKITTVGVDPAENIYESITANKTEHDIRCEFFSQNTVDSLKLKYGHFDIIIAQNVFAHIDYPSKFLNLCKQLLDPHGTLYIQTSQKNMVKENEFDTVYHEHLSFFNTNSMNILCTTNELFLNNVHENAIHGTSYIFEISKTSSVVSNVADTLLQELFDELYNVKTFEKYKLLCLQYRNNFQSKLLKLKLGNKNIIGFGSTAKSNTLLNFANIDSSYIDYIIDENPLKQNLHAPGSNILITDISTLKTHLTDNTVILVTAWNFYTEIKAKLEKTLVELDIYYPVELINIHSLDSELINTGRL